MIYAMFALVLLTFTIGALMLKARIASVKSGAVRPGYFKVLDGKNIPTELIQKSRNFSNLLETPVLFYIAAILVLVMDIESTLTILVAWSYVFFRCLHSYIHISYNHVIHRLAAFMASNACILALWIIILLNTG